MRSVVRSVTSALAPAALSALLLVGCSSTNRVDTSTPSSAETRGACTATAPAESGRRTIEVDGHEREYALHLPPGYDGTEPAPLILNLHGFGGTIDEQDESTQLPELAGQRGYIVVTPQGLPISVPSDNPAGAQPEDFNGLAFWNFFGSSGADFGSDTTLAGIDVTNLGVDDVAFFDALLDQLESDLCVDTARVYSTGMSNGAGMTTTLGCELGDRFDAIAPVSGVNLSGACPGDHPISVRAVHGDADDVAAFEGNSLMGFELGNPSVPARMAAWADYDRCNPAPETAEDPSVTIFTWEDCADGTRVELWVIHGGGHTWPRGASPTQPGPIDATTTVLDFFDDQGAS